MTTPSVSASPTHHYDYIDALRGWALLGTIVAHMNSVFTTDYPFHPWANQGARGVQLFYVASALTLMMSWHHKNDGAIPFYIRRLFRIAPMFWLAIVFFLVRHGLQPRWAAPDGIGALHILTSATFLHGWHPETMNGVVPGAWTIAVEMTFYALFPLLVMVCTSFWRSVAVFMATFTLSFAADGWLQPFLARAFPHSPEDLLKAFRFFFFFNHLPIFILGLAVYHAINEYRPRISVSTATIGAHACLIPILLLPFLPDFPPKHISYGVVFAVLAFFLGCGAQSRFVNARICHIGKVSYSGYLVHLALLSLIILNPVIDTLSSHIGLAFFDPALPRWLTVSIFTLSLWFAVTWVSIKISTLTYTYVERPMIKLGAQLAARWRTPAPAVETAPPLKVI